MEARPNQETILQRRKKALKFTDDEITLILRAYISHPTKWSDIVEDVRANIDRLEQGVRDLYHTATVKQLRERMSTKLSSLMRRRPEDIQNEQIRNLVESIRAMERRLIQTEPAQGPAPPNRQPIPAAQVAPPAPNQDVAQAPAQHAPPAPVRDAPRAIRLPQTQNARDAMAAALPPSSGSDTEQDQRVQQPRQRRKRPLADLVRENHMLYNKFMKKKLPKIMRDLGVSSDSD